MANVTLKRILEEKVWKISSTIAGIDKGAIASRQKSIDEILDMVSNELIVVGKGEIDLMIQMITEYIIHKINRLNKPVAPHEITTQGPTKDSTQLKFPWGDK